MQLFLKEKLPKRTLRRERGMCTYPLSLLKLFFFRRFFSLDKEKTRRKKRNLRREKGYAYMPLSLLKVLLGSFSFKKSCEL